MGRDVTKRAVLDAIDNCRVRRDDTLVFYWSGHGGYDQQRGHFLKMPNDEWLYRSEVINRIRRKEPRLGVVLTDCCANRARIEGPRAAFQRPPPTEVAPLLDELFFRSRGLVDINACAEGEIASYYENGGGFFTSAIALPGEVRSPLGGLYGRSERGIVVEPGDDWIDNPDQPLVLGFFWRHAVRRLMWQDLVKEITPVVGATFKRACPRGVTHRDGTHQRTQTVTAWSLPPVIRQDDHIIEINGRRIDDESDYVRAVSNSPREMRFTVRRVGERLHMRTSLRSGSGLRFGVDAENDSAYGVRVVEVEPNSPAARAELVRRDEGSVLLEEGDVLLRINDQLINNYDQFVAAVRGASGPMYFTLKNFRDGRVHWLKVDLRQTRPRFGVDVTARRGGGVRVTEVVRGSPATTAALAH